MLGKANKGRCISALSPGADAKWASEAQKESGSAGNPAPKRPSPVKPCGNREAFEADVLTRLALGRTIESEDEIAAPHGVHKGVASKWLKDMREHGLIRTAQRVGRCHRLVAETETA